MTTEPRRALGFLDQLLANSGKIHEDHIISPGGFVTMAKSVKKGDEVIVIAGDHKNKKGKVLQVIRDKNRVIVEGVNMIKKHERKTQDNPQGSIIEREASIHYSNVKLAE